MSQKFVSETDGSRPFTGHHGSKKVIAAYAPSYKELESHTPQHDGYTDIKTPVAPRFEKFMSISNTWDTIFAPYPSVFDRSQCDTCFASHPAWHLLTIYNAVFD